MRPPSSPSHDTSTQLPLPRRELRGVVERITYQHPETGYTVARLAPERAEAAPTTGDERLVTVVGTLPDLQPGEAIVATGFWVNDPKHGWQFRALEARTTLPATVQGMKRYLGSGLVKGIGPVMGGRIVEAFAEDTFAVIDETPQRLTEVPGIGPVRAGRIAATWLEQRQIREVMAALQGYGLSTSLAVRIYKRFGDDSARVIAHEPYRLAREVWGIGFKTADKIAQAIGIARDAPERLQAGVVHALGQAADEGHTLLPEADLVEQAAALLGAERAAIATAVTVLTGSGDLILATTTGTEGVEQRMLALAPFARAESGLASRLQALHAVADRTSLGQLFAATDWEVAGRWLATHQGMHLAPEQAAGVRMALTAPVSILTGGPGTGKTHTLRAILTLATAKRRRCLLAAPTGRAAKRMSEATGHPAGTLHRVLGVRPGGQALHGAEHPLDADLVIVDEASMLDAMLANQLVKAIAPGTHFLLVGDSDQLPSVGAGDVLADLLRSTLVPVTRLTHIFRQGAGSGIAANARRIKAGQLPRFGGGPGDCFFLPAPDPAAAAQIVVDLVAQRLPAHYGFQAGEVQVLAPMHRGEAGVGALNTRLQERLTPPREGQAEARGGGRVYRPGDRVLQLKNDYGLEVFNGDLGTVRGVEPVEQELLVGLDDGREIRYPFATLHQLTHAYAISVHKAQGAEFPAVVLPLLTTHAAMLSRTLLYTAVTRAQRLVVIVGQPRALALAVKDWRRAARHTALGELLSGSLRFAWPRSTLPMRAEDPARLMPESPESWDGLLGAAT
jgi:exodeoxyribonuclease V alpha subunit